LARAKLDPLSKHPIAREILRTYALGVPMSFNAAAGSKRQEGDSGAEEAARKVQRTDACEPPPQGGSRTRFSCDVFNTDAPEEVLESWRYILRLKEQYNFTREEIARCFRQASTDERWVEGVGGRLEEHVKALEQHMKGLRLEREGGEGGEGVRCCCWVVGWLGGCWSSHWSVCFCCQEEKSVRQLMKAGVEVPFRGLQAIQYRGVRVQFVTDVQIRSCKLRDGVTPDGWSGDVPFNDFPDGRKSGGDGADRVGPDTWYFIKVYPEPEIAFVAHLLLGECVRIARGELARHPKVYDEPSPVRSGKRGTYYLVDDHKQSGEGVGKWTVRNPGKKPCQSLKVLVRQQEEREGKGKGKGKEGEWFERWKGKISYPNGQKGFETPYDCAVAVYERIKELLAQASGDDEAVAEAKVAVAMFMLNSAPVVEYGTLLRTPRLLEKEVFGERYYEALERSGDDDARKRRVRRELRSLPGQIVGWVMGRAVVDGKIVHPKLPYLIGKDEKTGTEEQLKQRLRDVVEEVMGTFAWLGE